MARNLNEILERARTFLLDNRSAEALKICNELCTSDPGNAAAWLLRGMAAARLQDWPRAIASFQRFTGLRPVDPAGYINLGKAQHASGDPRQAAESYRTALSHDPDLSEAWLQLGLLAGAGKDYVQAETCFREIVNRQPYHAAAWDGLGAALQEQNKLAEAESCYRELVVLRPNAANSQINLGVVLQQQGRRGEAMTCYQEAVRIDPASALGHYNIGTLHKGSNDLDNAARYYRTAMELQPDFADAHFSYAMVLLVRGDYRAGWREYEWRWKCKGWQSRAFPYPRWNGESLVGKTLLLHAEQGYGDTLHFVRYAAHVAARGARVFLECQKPLVTLLSGCQGVHGIAAKNDSLPDADYQVPLLSLGGIFATDAESIPAEVPYITAPAEGNAAGLAQRVRRAAAVLRIGIAWAGSPTHVADRQRSCSPEQFRPLAELPGVKLYSLQKGPQQAVISTGSHGDWLEDLGGSLADFADTATVLDALDLVLTVDTAVAHLAGAMARPTWVLLHHVPDWRWLMEREDSPWYPTLRLFRQRNPGDWGEVFQRVHLALQAELS